MISRDDVERRLVLILGEILESSSIDKADNFIDLGITSLSTALFFMRVTREFGSPLSLSSLLQAPSIEDLAELIVAHSADPLDSCRLAR